MPFGENGFYVRAIYDQANDITQRFIKRITQHPYEIDTGQQYSWRSSKDPGRVNSA